MYRLRKTLMKNGLWPQWIAAAAVFLMGFIEGLVAGWTSPSLAVLLDPDSPITVTKQDASWIASLLNIGRVVGGLIGAIGVELFGSKTSVLHIGVMHVVGFICLAVADSVIWVYVSRAICGTAIGMFFISFPLYMGEVANPKIRGALVGLIAVGMTVGYIAGNLTGAYMSLAEFAIFALVITVIFLGSFYWLPKSPHHLILTDRLEEAQAAIQWYQRDADVSREFASVQRFIKEKQSVTYKNLLQEFMLPHNKIALMKVNIIYILIQLSGLYTVGFYMEIILTKAKVTVIDPAIVVAATSFIGLIGGCITMYAVDKCGRKIVVSSSSIGIAMTLSALAVHSQLLENGYDPVSLQWLPIGSTALIETFINMGMLPVPNTILSEIFAPNIKSYSSCIVNVISGLAAFIATQTYQISIDAIDYYIYYVYALMMLLLAVFVMVAMPETKGKSLEEIQQMLMTA